MHHFITNTVLQLMLYFVDYSHKKDMNVLCVSKRKSYSIKYKRDAVLTIEDLRSNEILVLAACRGLNLPHYYYRQWKKLLKNTDELEASKKAAGKPTII